MPASRLTWPIRCATACRRATSARISRSIWPSSARSGSRGSWASSDIASSPYRGQLKGALLAQKTSEEPARAAEEQPARSLLLYASGSGRQRSARAPQPLFGSAPAGAKLGVEDVAAQRDALVAQRDAAPAEQ